MLAYSVMDTPKSLKDDPVGMILGSVAVFVLMTTVYW